MKKKTIMKLCLSVASLLVLSSSSLFACTSFAVYSDRTFYGMNFDYDPSRELKFCIDTTGDLKVFVMKLEWEGDFFAPIVALNTEGLFGNVQMLFPAVSEEVSIDPGEIQITELLVKATTLRSCQDAIGVLNDHKVVMGTVSLHSLYADTCGDAMVVEVGPDENVITSIDGNFIVMTNFPLAEFENTPYETVYGAGSDRYKTAHRYLMENADAFDLDDGFTLLKSVVSRGTNGPTRCSMVFDPESNEVYIALEGNFDKIWKISLENETVETFRGFDSHVVMDIGEGVTASELGALEWGTSPGIEVAPESTIPREYVVVALILMGAGLLIGYKKRSRS